MSCRLLLEKYYIGDVDVRPGQQLDVIEYEEDLGDGQFFAVLKRRVEKYFWSNRVGGAPAPPSTEHAPTSQALTYQAARCPVSHCFCCLLLLRRAAAAAAAV